MQNTYEVATIFNSNSIQLQYAKIARRNNSSSDLTPRA